MRCCFIERRDRILLEKIIGYCDRIADNLRADVAALIKGVSKTHPINMEILEEIVRTDDKQRYSFNSDKTLIRANQGHSMVNVINYALSHNGVVPYYQGIYDNKEKTIHHYEALMRLKDENGRPFSSTAFESGSTAAFTASEETASRIL